MHPGGRGREGFRRGLDQGLVVGAVFALVETLFVFVTTAAPALDAIPIAVTNLLLWTLVSQGVEAMRQVLDRFGGVTVGSGAAPVVAISMLFVARRGGFGKGAAAGLLESALPVFLVLVMWWALRNKIVGPSGLAGIALVGLGASHGLLLFRALPRMSGIALGMSLALVATGLLVSALSGRMCLAAKRVVAVVSLAIFIFAAAHQWRQVPPPQKTSGSERITGAPGARNLVLIVMDTVRRDHLGLYGYSKPTTPRLEDLARQALVFENAYASSPYTLSSHASLFSGVLPSVHGARPVVPTKDAHARGFAEMLDLPIDERQPMLAERLRTEGYHTGLISANDGYVSESFGMDRGFDYFNSRGRSYKFHPWALTLSMRLPSRFGSGPWFRTKKTASQITNGALDWLARNDPEPFFLFLNYFDAHEPYHPPEPFDLDFSEMQTWANYFRYGGKASRSLPAAGLDFVRAQYDAGIAAIDREIGRLWDALKESGRDANTVFVVTSDHGEFFGEHGRFTHATTLYEEVLAVPLLVRTPGLSRAVRPLYRLGIHQIPDLALVLMQGGEEPEEMAARVALPEPALLAEFWHSEPKQGPPAVRAIYWDRYKLIQASDDRDELYDLAADPLESNNLLGAPTGAITKVRRRMIAGLRGMEVTPPARKTRTRDPETEERLRALGYIR